MRGSEVQALELICLMFHSPGFAISDSNVESDAGSRLPQRWEARSLLRQALQVATGMKEADGDAGGSGTRICHMWEWVLKRFGFRDGYADTVLMAHAWRKVGGQSMMWAVGVVLANEE